MGRSEPAVRRRCVEWEDQAASAQALRALSGIDFRTGILEGRLPAPPVARLLGFAFTEVAVGLVAMVLDPAMHGAERVVVELGG